MFTADKVHRGTVFGHVSKYNREVFANYELLIGEPSVYAETAWGSNAECNKTAKQLYGPRIKMASRFHIDPTFTGYGKSGVRLLKIKRNGKYHDVKQIEVATELKLATHQDYMTGNNASVVPTDTQKNTIYALAKDHPVR